jgi:hypothetical protein
MYYLAVKERLEKMKMEKLSEIQNLLRTAKVLRTEHAVTFFRAALNQHMDIILATMAALAEREAASLKAAAQKEIDAAVALLVSLTEEAAKAGIPIGRREAPVLAEPVGNAVTLAMCPEGCLHPIDEHSYVGCMVKVPGADETTKIGSLYCPCAWPNPEAVAGKQAELAREAKRRSKLRGKRPGAIRY